MFRKFLYHENTNLMKLCVNYQLHNKHHVTGVTYEIKVAKKSLFPD